MKCKVCQHDLPEEKFSPSRTVGDKVYRRSECRDCRRRDTPHPRGLDRNITDEEKLRLLAARDRFMATQTSGASWKSFYDHVQLKMPITMFYRYVREKKLAQFYE